MYIFYFFSSFFQPVWFFLGSYLVNFYFTLIFDHISQYKLGFHCFVKRVQWRILSLRNAEKIIRFFLYVSQGYRKFALKCLFFCYKYMFKRRNCLEIEPIRRKKCSRFKVMMQGKVITVAYTLRTYWNQFSLGGICKQE